MIINSFTLFLNINLQDQNNHLRQLVRKNCKDVSDRAESIAFLFYSFINFFSVCKNINNLHCHFSVENCRLQAVLRKALIRALEVLLNSDEQWYIFVTTKY